MMKTLCLLLAIAGVAMAYPSFIKYDVGDIQACCRCQAGMNTDRNRMSKDDEKVTLRIYPTSGTCAGHSGNY